MSGSTLARKAFYGQVTLSVQLCLLSREKYEFLGSLSGQWDANARDRAMAVEDFRYRAIIPEHVSRTIIPRPKIPIKTATVEERDSGHESNDETELKTIGRRTHEWDMQDRIPGEDNFVSYVET